MTGRHTDRHTGGSVADPEICLTGVPGILWETGNYTWGIVWHTYDTKLYPPGVSQF